MVFSRWAEVSFRRQGSSPPLLTVRALRKIMIVDCPSDCTYESNPQQHQPLTVPDGKMVARRAVGVVTRIARALAERRVPRPTIRTLGTVGVRTVNGRALAAAAHAFEGRLQLAGRADKKPRTVDVYEGPELLLSLVPDALRAHSAGPDQPLVASCPALGPRSWDL
jgi:hypothetical protein